MISISNKEWREKMTNSKKVEKYIQDNNISSTLSKLIISRNFNEEELFYTLEKDTNKIFNIFLKNDDFNKSANLLIDIIKKKETVIIFGDYDVDGSCATSLLINFLKYIEHPHFFYIPDREKDGYGPNKDLFKKLLLKKPKLVIMVDCGSNSLDEISFLKVNKVKTIIIDHHQINKPFPKADTIINPKKDNGYIEFDYFCATTLTYFFLDLVLTKLKKNNHKNISKFKLEKFSIYVLLATICDVMPLRGLNRKIANQILDTFNFENNNAIKTLFEHHNKNNKLTTDDLGFFIGPILNAGGRLGKSEYATKLLTSSNNKSINEYVKKLSLLNLKRQKYEQKIISSIDFDKLDNNKNIINLFDKSINEGLIGIIAARIKEHFNKPSIVLTKSGNLLKGSARSIFNFDIGIAIQKAKDLNIIINGGGHKMAAGFSLEKKNYNKFVNFLDDLYIKQNPNHKSNHFSYDLKVSSSAFNKTFFNEINKLKPFGNGNPEPLFLFEKIKIIKSNIINNKHISSILKSHTGKNITSICFNSLDQKIGSYLLNYKKEINIIGTIRENFWNNKFSLQLYIKDIII